MIKTEAGATGIEQIMNGEVRIGTDRAHGFYNNIHLMIVPAPHGGTGFHVFFTEDDLGKPDFSKIRNSRFVYEKIN
ncbi:hypothetical protein KKD03_02640 [Patescibacteria group bacterium]|nr:hypothetical protein [Patescibacteria group bacterium]